jgi:two-component system, OmpR family, response regulator MprA
VKLLVVDDDPALQHALRRALNLAGYEVSTVGAGFEALAAVGLQAPDAVILDIGLPDLNGFDVCRRLRAQGQRVPVLMLTARDAVEDRIDGLDAGADDYLVKPFEVGELIARIRALLRRSAPDNGSAEPAFGTLRLDGARHGVSVDDRFVELTRTEFQLLELLLRNPRRVLTHSVIYDRVWGYDFGPSSNALRCYISYLRRKLEAAGSAPLIHTVHGVGYVLREP